MYYTIVGFKGGVAKSTSAIHLAAYLHQKAPTLLVDGDPNRSVTAWARKATLPFQVIDERLAARYIREGNYTHVVLDTQARPGEEDLKVIAEGADFLIVPTTPDYLSLDALVQTAATLQALGASRYRVLITKVPPHPRRDGEEARALLEQAGLPLFRTAIRRFSVFEDAAAFGIPVSEMKSHYAQEGWHDYQNAWEELPL